MTLNELFEKYRSNPCESLLSEILKDSQFLVYGIVINIVKHNQDAEDLTQDVLIKVIQNINDLPQNTYFIPWLNRISLNAAIDLYQQKKRIKTAIPHLSNIQEAQKNITTTDNDETISILYQHLSKLDDNDQSMIINKHIHQMTYAQLGNLYQLPISTIQTKIEATLKRLKSSIEKAGFAGVALGLTSTLEQFKMPNVALDLLSKLKMHFPSSYPKASAELLSSKVSTKTVMSTIQGKTLSIIIGVVLLISLTGLYFLYDVLSRDEKQRNEKAIIAKNNSSNKKENSTNITTTELQKVENTIPKSNSVIVDQTLFSPKAKVEKPQAVNEVLGAELEKFDTEITLFDGDNKKLLTECDVEFRYMNFDDRTVKVQKLKSDNNGKFIFTTAQSGLYVVQLLANDYLRHKNTLNVRFGRNEYRANFYKGGSIEIHAINDENKLVEGLVVSFNNDFFSQAQDFLVRDVARGLYVLSNIPLGTHQVTFAAIGCQQSPAFSIKVESKNSSFVEVKLHSARKIYFDLEVKSKPDKIKIDYSDVYKNQNDLYEYVIDNGKTLSSLFRISADKYVLQFVNVEPNRNTYKISLEVGFTGKLQINNEAGKAITGALVEYRLESLDGWQVAETSKEGIAFLTGLREKTNLNIRVSHKNYTRSIENWLFNAKEQNSKEIVLTESKGFVGKIKFGEKIVMGAKVVLIENFSHHIPKLIIDSGADGSYQIYNNEGYQKGQEYLILASHRDYGVAISPPIKFENKIQIVDLTLVPEKSLAIKLVDSSGKPLPNKTIILTPPSAFNSYGGPGYSFKTDEKGEYEGFNLIHGNYSVGLIDDKLSINKKYINPTIQIPNDKVVLIAEPKYFKKVVVNTSDGLPYRGLLKVNGGKNNLGKNSGNVFIGEDGNYYLEFSDENENLHGGLVFVAEGHAPDRVSVGQGDKAKDLPNDFKVELTKGETVKIKVIDTINNRPIPFAMVEVSSSEYSNHLSNQTNNLGEILFTHLKGKFKLTAKIDNYAPYKTEFDVSQGNEIIVKLSKGGGLKGLITLDKSISASRLFLKFSDSPRLPMQPFEAYLNISAASNFEFFNLTPGEYSLRIIQKLKDGKESTKTMPKIVIENEKITEINLDEVLKN